MVLERFIRFGILTLASVLLVRPGATAEAMTGPERERLLTYATDTWRSVTAMVQPNGLPADGLRIDPSGVGTPTTYTSPTNIAAYLWSVLAAESLGLIEAPEAGSRIDRTLATLEQMDRAFGFYHNWYDPATAAPLETWPGDESPMRKFLSSVDNGWLAAALMMVQSAKPDFAARAEALLQPMDFNFFYDAFDPADPIEHPGLFHVGVWTDTRTPTTAHYGLLNTEARIISYVGIARGQIDAEHYYRLRRTLPPEVTWQQQIPDGKPQVYRGVPVFEGHYTYRDMRVVPSWGGSMFEALMVPLFVPETVWGPMSWGVNHPLYVQAQIEYGKYDAGHGFWGYSPSSRPSGGYTEYGVPALGTMPGGYPPRDVSGIGASAANRGEVVTPHATFLALSIAPEEALANLASLTSRFPIYGSHGFFDSVDVGSGQVAEAVLVLDQGMILAAIANVLVDHIMQDLFSTGTVEATIRPLLDPEQFTAGEGPFAVLTGRENSTPADPIIEAASAGALEGNQGR